MEESGLSFGKITEKNLGQFKKINLATLDVKYSDAFYHGIVTQWKEHVWFTYLTDIPVGSLTAREEVHNDELSVYVMTCSVLKPYRRSKIATKMMAHLEETVRHKGGISKLYLHVWTVSIEALDFYRALGFQVTGEIDNYYKDLDPQTAYILEKRLDNQ